ncbi:unnamed protein product [Eruca vesicaria subsp. sativa]|uniref:Uncharacterized protein n=1 Tax=Eruca vesicaria subsp. sativa TaxID=29727 RepID=A0ABC8LDY7_ERUVS|nr:unnamed protein product [Eruca vesicaria subsp. sativa]
MLVLRGLTHKGTIYGLGSVQYKNDTSSVPVQVTLQRNLDMEMRLCGVETTVAEVKADICGLKTEFKEEMSAARASMDMILQVLLSQGLQPQVSVPTASTTQPSQPQAQRQPQPQASIPTASTAQPSLLQPQAQGQSHPQPQHLTTDNQADLDRWCQRELGM